MRPLPEGGPIPANTILVCIPNRDLRLQVEEALAAAGHSQRAAATAAEATELLRDRSWDLLVAEGVAVGGSLGTLRAAGKGTVPILAIAPVGDVEARIAYLEAGADDVLGAGFSRRELEARVDALLIRSGRKSAAGAQPSASQVIAVFAPKGGVGTTTIATNLALLLGARSTSANPSGSRVLIADFAFQFGQVATHLNLSPRFDIADLAADEPALSDPDLAAQYLTAHGSGVSVLAAPSHPESAVRLNVGDIEKIVALYRSSFDYIIIDAGSRIDPRTSWAFEQAAIQLFVAAPELPALRALRDFLSYLDETQQFRGRRMFVVNNVHARRMLSSRDLESILRARPVAEIPYEAAEMVQAVNRGVPIVLSKPSSPAGAAFEKLTAAIAGAAPQMVPAKADSQKRRTLGFSRR